MVILKDISICIVHRILDHCWASQFTCDKHGNMGVDDQHSKMIKTDKTCSVCKIALNRINPTCKYKIERKILD